MRRLPSLDGLRAISILLVVVGHWAGARYQSPILLTYASSGVRIFFVISGYLITTLLLQEQTRTSTINLKEFYVRRAYRILPAATVFMVPVMLLRRHELSWYHAAAAALYLADFDLTRPAYLGHLWSLSVEEQFYLLWPGVLKKWFKYRIGLLLSVIAVGPLYQLVCYALRISGAGQTFPAVADTLAIGCLLAIVSPRLPRISTWVGWMMVASIAFTPMFVGDSKIRTLVLLFFLWPIMYVSIAGVLLWVLQSPPRLLNLGPVEWLGKISYSLYLWQQIFIYDRHLRPWYYMLFALGMACASYYLIERPMLRLREKRRTAPTGSAMSVHTETEPAAAARIA